MPELPEVEIVARRLNASLAGAQIESALAPGVVALKTLDPPLQSLAGRSLTRVRRVGKMVVVEAGDLALLIHLMSAGRLGPFDTPAKRGDRSLRLVLRLAGGRELRLRELGRRQRAWVKLLARDAIERDEAVAKLGPEAWPAPSAERFAAIVAQPRHLHSLLRDQRAIAGIGRSWVDEILWTASLSPFAAAEKLEPSKIEELRDACDSVLGGAIEHYERTVGERLPERFPMPLAVHGRQGEPCPRCGATLAAVHYEDYVMTYCPDEQAGGQPFKDRRLSRLLK